jgi:hypothetical protein
MAADTGILKTDDEKRLSWTGVTLGHPRQVIFKFIT